jgi:pimeloyl-ACP methyl ester carboxylesterase
VVAPPNRLRGPGADSAYLASYLQTISGPIVLVAHSYGGFVITNAATGNKNVKALVYIDSLPARRRRDPRRGSRSRLVTHRDVGQRDPARSTGGDVQPRRRSHLQGQGLPPIARHTSW